MFFATFMAAGVGNALWHFVRDIDLVSTLGPAAALETYSSYLVYSAVLLAIAAARLSLLAIRAASALLTTATRSASGASAGAPGLVLSDVDQPSLAVAGSRCGSSAAAGS